MENKLKLYGFNNLTKALSFNIYDVCYAKTEREQQKYIAYIDEQYNSDRLVKILTNVSQMIGAEVLNISKQDYDPQGASVTLLLAEDAAIKRADSRLVLGHLDKSHVTAHTYPEYHPETCIATFRVDIDVETCGEITPLSTLDYLIGSFDSDIITLDYRVQEVLPGEVLAHDWKFDGTLTAESAEKNGGDGMAPAGKCFVRDYAGRIYSFELT